MSTNTGFSGLIGKYTSGQTGISATGTIQSAFNILSSDVIVPNSNPAGHTAAGYIYIANYLIQFSATRNLNNQSTGGPYSFTYPLQFADANNCILVSTVSPNNAPVINTSSQATSTGFTLNIGSQSGNTNWLAIGRARGSTGAIFPNLLSTFSNALGNYGSSMADILSLGTLVPSLNTTQGHNFDGFIYIGKLLIQFSLTSNITPTLSNGSSTIFRFPIPYANTDVPYNVILSGVNTGSNNTNTTLIDPSGNITNTSFRVLLTNNGGNVRWLSIGPAPTTPLYQSTATAENWTCISCNGTFNYIVAGTSTGNLYFSSNNTRDFTLITFPNSFYTPNWSSVSVNDDNTFGACEDVYYMSNITKALTLTSGVVNMSSSNWFGVTISKTSNQIFAVKNNSYIYTLANNNLNLIQITGSGQRNWQSIASSNDGTKLVACVLNGFIYTSTNSGLNWTARATGANRNWVSVASSVGGSILVACVLNGFIYISEDSGVNWTARATGANRDWFSVASSSNGTYLVACVNGGAIWISKNTGTNWSASSDNRNWTSVATESVGSDTSTKLVACASGDYIYTSQDTGSNWTQRTTSGIRNWSSVASSSNGTNLVACVNGGYIYTSSDSGATWTPRATDANRNWISVSSSTNGDYLVACVNGGSIYISTNSGATWTEQNKWWDSNTKKYLCETSSSQVYVAVTGYSIYSSINLGINWSDLNPPVSNYSGITTSTDGTIIAVCTNGGNIYTSYNSGSSWIIQTNSGSRNWSSITSNNTGQYLAATVDNGFIYTSSDYGINWVQRNVIAVWTSITSDITGRYLKATVNNIVYYSNDYGATWLQVSVAGTLSGISSNNSGSFAIVARNGGTLQMSYNANG